MANSSNAAKIQLKIRNLIEGHQSGDIVVFKFQSAVADQYKQATSKTFDTGTEVIGRATPQPTEDILTAAGVEEEVDMMFVFSRLELLDKFPTLPEPEWITNDDEIEHNGLRFRVVRVWGAGRLDTTYSHMVVFGMTSPGAGKA